MIIKTPFRIIHVLDDSYNIEASNGTFLGLNDEVYYKGYLIHREDGPAIEYNSGINRWFINGINYSKEEYWKIINCYKKRQEILNDIL